MKAQKKYLCHAFNACHDRSDIVLMVVNSRRNPWYDKRHSGFAHEAGKGIIIVVNKWDTIKKTIIPLLTGKQISRDQFQFLSYAPIIFIGWAKQRLNKLPEMIKRISESSEPSYFIGCLEWCYHGCHCRPTQHQLAKENALRFSMAHRFRLNHQHLLSFVNDRGLCTSHYMPFLWKSNSSSLWFWGNTNSFDCS